MIIDHRFQPEVCGKYLFQNKNSSRTLVGVELSNESDPLLDESKTILKAQEDVLILENEVLKDKITGLADQVGHQAFRVGYDFLKRDAKNSLVTNIMTSWNTQQSLQNSPVSVPLSPQTSYSANLNGVMLGRFNLGKGFDITDKMRVDNPFAEVGVAFAWGGGETHRNLSSDTNIQVGEDVYDKLHIHNRNMLSVQMTLGADMKLYKDLFMTRSAGMRATYLSLDKTFLSRDSDPNTTTLLYAALPSQNGEQNMVSTSIPLSLTLHDKDYSYRVEMNNDILLGTNQVITEFIAQYGDLYDFYGRNEGFALMGSVTKLDDWHWKVRMQTPSFGGPFKLQGGLDGNFETGLSRIRGGAGYTIENLTIAPQLTFQKTNGEVSFEFEVRWTPKK